MQTIGIIGQGFVGTAVKEGLKQYFKIKTFDLIKERSSCKTLEEVVKLSDIIFVCIPTPMNNNGSCCTDIVQNVLEQTYTFGKGKVVVVKSTIPPGTTERWNKKYSEMDIIFNPEFLTEANAINDFKNQNRIIIGGPKKAASKVRRIFVKAFPKAKIIKTDSTYAEMVKYITNSFLAMKVSFANEMYQICDKLEIDYDKVIEYAMHDERLGYSHWSVPGPDGDFGYGGHCFPKDVRALINLAESLGVPPLILSAINIKNNQVRTNRDWEGMEGRAVVKNEYPEGSPLNYLTPSDYQMGN